MAFYETKPANTARHVLHAVLGAVLIALVMFAPPASANIGTVSATRNRPARDIALDNPESLAAFFDAIVPGTIEAHSLPGVTLAVVKDGEPIFAKGYGHADLERRIPVDPETTLFDVGSIAKLFTFTAVMQLVEQGRLDLHADVNRYLTHFQIPATFPEPVTAAHLLTHTGGFDEWDLGAAARTPEAVLPVCEYLAQRLPPRVRPPGQLIAYSNHGTALAGCLVEEITGSPFADAVDTQIFTPLEMTRSTFLWPADLMADMAVGYRLDNGMLHPMDRYYRHFGPAGELKTTATDITRFMIAHLQAGVLADARILDPETAQRMHRQQFTHHPRLTGFTYGFFEDEINGRRALVHGGDTNPIFSSLLVLLPEEQVGFFVAHNTAEYAFRDALVRAFMDRYFPDPTPFTPLQPVADHADRAGRFTGRYAPTFMTRETSLEKLLTLFAQFRITADPEGVLTLHEPPQLAGDEPTRWVEVEPEVFQRLDRDDLLIFFAHNAWATSLYPAAAFVRRTWVDGPTFHLALLGICTLLFVSALATWFWRRHRATLGWHQQLLPATAALGLLFIIGVAVMLQALAFDAIYGLPLWAQGLLGLPVLVAVLTILALAGTVRAWKTGEGSCISRVHDSLIVLGTLAFLWQVLYWNLTILHLL